MSELSPTENPTGLPAELVKALPTGPTWQEQDGALRDMWMQNKTPQVIADTLNRSISAIMTRAARLGLPRRSAPGRKPGRRAHDENGVPLPIARRETTRAAPADAPPQTSLRVCLMCLNKFESMGRHNRICSSCKGSSEYALASTLPDIHLPVS